MFLFFLLLQAANVHAGINSIHITIMILEDCGRGVEMHSFGTKGPGETFWYSKTNVPKIFSKRFIKQITTEKPNGLKLLNSHQHRLQLMDRQHHRLQLVDRQHHRLQLLDRQHHRLRVMDRQ